VEGAIEGKLLGSYGENRIRLVPGNQLCRAGCINLISRSSDRQIALQQQIFGLSEREPRGDGLLGILGESVRSANQEREKQSGRYADVYLSQKH
jgi:hypothetical protein